MTETTSNYLPNINCTIRTTIRRLNYRLWSRKHTFRGMNWPTGALNLKQIAVNINVGGHFRSYSLSKRPQRRSILGIETARVSQQPMSVIRAPYQHHAAALSPVTHSRQMPLAKYEARFCVGVVLTGDHMTDMPQLKSFDLEISWRYEHTNFTLTFLIA